MERACRDYRSSLLRGEHPAPESACPCPDCARFTRQLEQVQQALGELPPTELPAAVRSRLHARLAETGHPTSPLAHPGLWLFAASAAAVLLVLWTLWPSAPASLHIAPQQHLLVDLELSADPELGPIELSLPLPEGLQLASSDPALLRARELRWREPAGGGTSRRTFALQAVGAGRWLLRLEARAGDRRATAVTEVLVGTDGSPAAARREALDHPAARLVVRLHAPGRGAPWRGQAPEEGT
ncbi:MAG: hypothetical protein RBU45_04440 [Myxococcota bacterium]|jgi:hypothetical protein|nr:hypothetical protein [Myxococcota bacterium]